MSLIGQPSADQQVPPNKSSLYLFSKLGDVALLRAYASQNLVRHGLHPTTHLPLRKILRRIPKPAVNPVGPPAAPTVPRAQLASKPLTRYNSCGS